MFICVVQRSMTVVWGRN